MNIHTFERHLKYDIFVNVEQNADGQNIEGTDVLDGRSGIDLSSIDLPDNYFDITLEDKLGNATRVGLDSLSYDLSKEVDKVELIVYLESGTEYKYNVS